MCLTDYWKMCKYSWKSLKLQSQFFFNFWEDGSCVAIVSYRSTLLQDLHFRFMMIICSSYFRKEEDPHLYKFESPFQRTISAKFSSIWHNGFRWECWSLFKYNRPKQNDDNTWCDVTWWRSFQKCVMCTKFDIYDFITITGSLLLVDKYSLIVSSTH
jgi:hypothetical protein